MKSRITGGCLSLALAMGGMLACGSVAASAKIITLPTLTQQYAQQSQMYLARGFNPPAVPCPENGDLPSTPVTGPCGVTELPATGLPVMANMAYYGGHVQVHPHEYLVFWGWGEKGAWPATDKCTAESITEGTIHFTLPCDPDGAGKYTANWVNQMGGTAWAGTQSQYYQTVNDSSGNPYNQYIDTSAKNWLSGVWVDNTNNITGIGTTSGSNPAGPTNTYTDLAAEAARAALHFKVSDLADANFIIFQPANYSDPNALATGYCAFHDYIYPNVEGGIYDSQYTGGVENTQYTNLPYLLDINSSGINVCGENAVNSGAAGKLDGYSIALGHEIMETATDPGAEDVIGSGTSVTHLGGWYDTIDADENGDKCAWVGENPLTATGPPLPIPGAMGDITGNSGQTFAVQSLWSNNAAEGAGYCAGAGTDLPVPSQ
jgi:hypothetical protein